MSAQPDETPALDGAAGSDRVKVVFVMGASPQSKKFTDFDQSAKMWLGALIEVLGDQLNAGKPARIGMEVENSSFFAEFEIRALGVYAHRPNATKLSHAKPGGAE